MPLQAVIFDYGMVLSGKPDFTQLAEILRLTGVERGRADALYRKHRNPYDQGLINGYEYWQRICEEAGLKKTPEEIAHLAELDTKLWTVYDPEIVAWQQQLKQYGLKTAILSNMGDLVHKSIVASFPWIENFDVQAWSYQLRLIKPDPAIYRHVIEKLEVDPAEALFLDDLEENVLAAQSVGMQALVYAGIKHLREQLAELQLGPAFPLPE